MSGSRQQSGAEQPVPYDPSWQQQQWQKWQNGGDLQMTQHWAAAAAAGWQPLQPQVGHAAQPQAGSSAGRAAQGERQNATKNPASGSQSANGIESTRAEEFVKSRSFSGATSVTALDTKGRTTAAASGRPKRRFDLPPSDRGESSTVADGVPPRPPPPSDSSAVPPQRSQSDGAMATQNGKDGAQSAGSKRPHTSVQPTGSHDRHEPAKRRNADLVDGSSDSRRDPRGGWPDSDVGSRGESRDSRRYDGNRDSRRDRGSTTDDRDGGRDGGRAARNERQKERHGGGWAPPDPPPHRSSNGRGSYNGKSSFAGYSNNGADFKELEELLYTASSSGSVESARKDALQDLDRSKRMLEKRHERECKVLTAAADVLAGDDSDLSQRLRTPLAENISKLGSALKRSIAEVKEEVARKYAAKRRDLLDQPRDKRR